MPIGTITTSTNTRTFSLTVQGVNLTTAIPVETIRISETASDSVATMEFTVEYPLGTTNFAWLVNLGANVILTDITNSRRLFAGTLVSARRVHLAGPGVAIACTATSYDAILDRKMLPRWWTTTNGTQTATKISSDREIVQAIIAAGVIRGFTLSAPNATVRETNTAMPKLQLEDGSVRQAILEVAEAAATVNDPTARRVYVDFDAQVHYFKGDEDSDAPYRVGDASYTTVVKATSGLVSLWALGEPTGATAYDAMSYAHGTWTGSGYVGGSSLTPNEPQRIGWAFNGSTNFVTASGANLHPGNTFSVELWFKRGATQGTAQTMVSAGSGDFEIGFNASNQLIVYKEGTGTNFVTDATYTSTTTPYHLVVTREPGDTKVYVNGVEKAGTTTARTFNAAAGAVNIGRRLSSTDRYFSGTLQHVAIYDSKLTAATVLAHYQDGWTIVPDYIDFETFVGDMARQVFIRGGTSTGTGWVFGDPSRFGGDDIIDRPNSTTVAIRDAIGQAYLARDVNKVDGGRILLTGFDGWRAGQSLAVDDAGLGVSGTYEIKQIETMVNMGSGVTMYDISYGALPWSGTFSVARKRRRRTGSAGAP